MAEFALARYRANGALDTTFGGTGRVVTAFPGLEAVAQGVALDTQGRIVAAGSASGSIAVARYLSNGALDASFSGDGRVTTGVAVGAQVNSVTTDSQNRVIVAGYAGNGRFMVARYRNNGTLDPSFGGVRIIPIPGAAFAMGTAVVLSGIQRIVVAGSTGGVASRLAVAQLLTNGTLDPAFGPGGIVVTSFPGFVPAFCDAVALQAGRVVAAGQASGSFVLSRYLPNGSLDPGFDLDGRAVIPWLGVSLGKVSMAVDVQSRLVLAAGHTPTFKLVRAQPQGVGLDTTFGTLGRVQTTFPQGQAESLAVAVDGLNRAVAAGYLSVSGGGALRFALARYRANGTLMPSFGNGGRVVTPFPQGQSVANAVKYDAQGRIVAAGVVNPVIVE